jgi:hypothetical protein
MLTRLCQQTDGLHIQMSSVAHLCKVHPKAKHRDARLPEGVALLAYLYQEICKVNRRDVICILYSALQACCQVYFRYAQDHYKHCISLPVCDYNVGWALQLQLPAEVDV